MRSLKIAAILISLLGAPVAAQDVARPMNPTPPAALPAVVAARAAAPIAVDGDLSDAGWADAQVIKLIYEWFPGDNVAPPVGTECRVAYDDENLYVGCEAQDDEPSQIRANFADRDRATADDHIVILLDPFNDRRRAFQFRLNPLGVQMDAIFADGFEDFSWDAIWASAGRITAEGYAVEAAIPFKSLRFPRGADVQTWGLILERSWPRSQRHRIRSVPTDRNNACLLCQAGPLTGFTDITPGRDVELNPTATASRTDARASLPAGALDGGDAEMEAGLNARWGITPNVSLNATINPDFSQVEADAAQLDVNTRFALFFPEKRPFFLEGADIFRTMIPLIFTRTVRDPLAGVKASGKEGANAFGFFATRDRATGLLFPANQGSRSAQLEQEVNTVVARYRRDVGASSTLGAVYTGRMGDEYGNHTASLDGLIRFSPSNNLQFQYVHTETDYPDSVAAAFRQPTDRFGGNALIAQLSHNSRNWNAFAQFQEVGEQLRGDAGFLPRVDVRVYRTMVNRSIWGRPGGWFTRIDFGGVAQHLADNDGQLTDRGATASVQYLGPRQSVVYLYTSRRDELFAGTLFGIADRGFFSEIRPNGRVLLGLRGDFGDAVDYSNAREAKLMRLGPSAELRVGRHASATLSHTFERLDTQDGARIFDANLTQGRLVYNFNTRAFVRAIVQYRSVDREQAQYAQTIQPEQQTVASQFLFSYKVNPQTVLFLGYSDNYLGQREFDLLQTDRTFFLKLGYAWRL